VCHAEYRLEAELDQLTVDLPLLLLLLPSPPLLLLALPCCRACEAPSC
jgi:hypothetical protein